MEKKHDNVLYVDDDAANLTVFIAAFRHYYNIFTANSALDALAILKQNPIQVVITDQRMPDMSGIQFLEVVMADFPDVIRIVLTAFIDIDSIIEAINTGRVYGYVTKPWDERELKAMLDSALKSFHSYQYNREKIKLLENKIVEQQNIIDQYNLYTPPHIKEEILTSNQSSLDGQLRVVTIVFVEILDLDSLIGDKEPQNGIAAYNSFLSFISKIVLKNKGSINKTLGDKVMTLFGAPVSAIENPKNGIISALEILKELKTFNLENNTSVELAIAISQGDVITGNAKIDHSLDYTVIGDAVVKGEQLLIEAKSMKKNGLIISKAFYSSLEPYHLPLEITEKEVVAQGEKFIYYDVEFTKDYAFLK